MLRINRGKLNSYLPYVLIFCMVLSYSFTTGLIKDDIWYGDALINRNIFSFLDFRYNTWTSRIIIEFCWGSLSIINLNIWRIINSLIFLLIPYSISKLFDTKNKYLWLVTILILLYPMIDMKEAGWIATTTNYLWPLAFGLFAFIPLMDLINKKEVSKIRYIISTILLAYAVNSEQMCCLTFGFFLLSLIYFKFIKKEKIPIYVYIGLGLSIISFLNIYLCPGNNIRVDEETKTWFPDFKDFGILSKMSIGVLSTASILMDNKIFISLFSLLLCFCIYKTNKDRIAKIISLLNVIIVNILIILRHFGIFKSFFNNISYKGLLIDKNNLFDLDRLIPFIFSIYLISVFGYLIYKLFGKKNILPLIIYIAGFLSRFILCFSPTVFASGSSTMIYYYFSMIIVMFLSYKSIDKLINRKEKLVLWIILITYTVFNIVIEIF